MTNKLAIDLETTGLSFKKDKIVCLGAQIGHSKIYLHRDDFRDEIAFRIAIREALSDSISKGAELTFHNSKFDMKFLWSLLGKDNLVISHDTMIMAYVLAQRPIRLSLDSLASYYLGLPSWKDDFDLDTIFQDKELLKAYCQTDVETTLKLADLLEERLRKENRWDFYVKLMHACNTILDVEFTGILLDKDESYKLIDELKEELEKVDSELKVIYPKVNWNSPKQVIKLFEERGLNVIHPLTKKKSSDIKVIKQNLEKEPSLSKIVQFKEVKKKIGSIESYLTEHSDNWGIINPNFNLASTSTGRLSSSGPNLQQVDKDPRIRSLFRAAAGREFVIGDMAQIEVRMAAHYSKDPTLIKMFNDELDFYGTIAVGVLKVNCHPNEVKKKFPKMRDVAKVIGLSILYGTGANRLRNEIKQSTGIDYSIDEIRNIIKNYFETFPKLQDLRQGVDKVLNERGYILNLMGRPVDVKPADIYMTGVNALLQSSASDLLLFKQEEVIQKLEEDTNSHLLALIHDEVIYETMLGQGERVKKILTDVMENNKIGDVTLRVPLKFGCNIGPNWSIKD